MHATVRTAAADEMPVLDLSALTDGGDIVDVVVASGLMSREEVASLLSAARLNGEQIRH